MSAGSACPRALGCAAAIMAGAMAAQGQITITGADMFNQVGQYYLAYANDPNSTNTVDVSGMLGTAGSVTQAWNFTTGPQDVTNRYDYLAASNTPYGADFVAAGAQMAQQLTIEGATNGLEWFYFTQDPVKGQIDYGLHEPSPGPVLMDWVFTSPLQDFPASIHYGDSWSGATVFYTTYSRVPVQITLTSTDTVDAFGYVTLPNNGLLDCLRVRELDELDFAFSDVFGVYTTNSFMLRALSYYWLAPRHGIVAQIDSQQYISYQFPGTNAPPDDLGGQAASVERMFEAYHPVAATNPPSTISGFTLTPGSTAFLLQWTTLTGVSSYTVEYATSLAGTINWQALGSTASSFMVDPAPATPGAPVRYYRVAGALGSK